MPQHWMGLPSVVIGPVLLDYVNCNGDEASLLNCEHVNTAKCDHSSDAGVDCLGEPFSKHDYNLYCASMLEVKFRLYILSSFMCIAGHSVAHTSSVYTLCKCMCIVECGIQFTGFAIQFLVLLVKLTVEYLNQQFLVSQ